jgi:hypothetical protein
VRWKFTFLKERKTMSKELFEQIASAYREMSSEARYRPAAPSDGFGNITVPAEELNLEKEAAQYAKNWWAEEDNLKFFVGCCDFQTRRATIYAIEASRNMCGGKRGDATALRLLKMAVKELELVMENRSNKR